MFQKTTINIVLAILCLDFSSIAQDKIANITALKIGDKVPDITINNIINYKDANGKPAKSIKISDFKGKLLILDFWATWCGPCITMIPKIDSLQKQFAQKVQFFPVAYQSESVIQTFLSKYQRQQHITYELPNVTEDQVLGKLFPHKDLPHFVWINSNGIVKSITEYDIVDKEHIEQLLKTDSISVRQKHDVFVPFQKDKPLLINGNGGNGDNIMFHSLITPYRDGLPWSVNFDYLEPGKPRRVTALNQSIANLFATAFGGDTYWFGSNKRIFLSKDSSNLTSNLHGQAVKNWMGNGHGFSYELIVPPSMAKDLFLNMQSDLLRFFSQYDVSIQKIPTRCLALVRTSSIDKIQSKGGPTITDFDKQGCQIKNNYLIQLTGRLDIQYLQNRSPIVDATGYNSPVDINIDANLSNLDQLNAELKKYDLALKESVQPIEMLVFKDRE
ncbi:Thiol-disulfide isomerase or thioredoxin [Pedobacter westerhofensis]|uniref:Thiol-disulfide isomerase or thioredoxin n=1 Tax=Pedobacter westerhofensis TaxID=425512 RepID=A0A521DPU0_9SPHI|nr:TlpA disulfide reductase family protein [Pedobacter westerhofensis]SMO73585.1 Thiol-disulfide isomerase or thioredoxin [Pedobacter westerhofensis]